MRFIILQIIMSIAANELETCGASGCLHGCMINAYFVAWNKARIGENRDDDERLDELYHILSVGSKNGCHLVHGYLEQIRQILS